jgi:hypothetical protein
MTTVLPTLLGAAGGHRPYWYTMYGLRVRSDLPLPVRAEALPADTPADLAFVHAGTADDAPRPTGEVAGTLTCDHGTTHVIVYRGDDGSWLWNLDVGLFHLLPGDRQVDVYPERGADMGVVGLVLAGQVAVYTLSRRGVASLHAGAVVTPAGAVAFMGAHGQGKSTMTAAMLRRGAALLADDALALGTRGAVITGLAGPRFMKLWPESVSGTLGPHMHLPDLARAISKKRIDAAGRFALAGEAPIVALYELDRYDATDGAAAITIERLSPSEALAMLLRHVSSSMFLRTGDVARLLPRLSRLAAQAPVRRLRYPAGYAYQDAVHAAVMQDSETR